jgi:hypothetical protein
MGFRFYRRVRLFPGARLNFSKGGISFSLGRRGSWLTFGKRGTRATVGIPGTGLSYSESSPWKAQQSQPHGSCLGKIFVVLLVAGVIGAIFSPSNTKTDSTQQPQTQVGKPALSGSLPVQRPPEKVETRVAPVSQPVTPHTMAPSLPAQRQDIAKASEVKAQVEVSEPAKLDLRDVAKSPYLWPNEVRLKDKVTFPALSNGKVIGIFDVPAGTTVKVLTFDGQRVEISYSKSTTRVFANVTDFEERVLHNQNQKSYPGRR